MSKEPIICVRCGQEIEVRDVEALSPDGEPYHRRACPTGEEADEPDDSEPSHKEQYPPWRKNPIKDRKGERG